MRMPHKFIITNYCRTKSGSHDDVYLVSFGLDLIRVSSKSQQYPSFSLYSSTRSCVPRDLFFPTVNKRIGIALCKHGHTDRKNQNHKFDQIHLAIIRLHELELKLKLFTSQDIFQQDFTLFRKMQTAFSFKENWIK